MRKEVNNSLTRQVSLNELETAKLISETVHQVTINQPMGSCIRLHEFSPKKPIAIAIVGHAMFARSNYLCRKNVPSLTSSLLQDNIKVFLPDMRSHGGSAQTQEWSFEQLLSDVTQCRAYIESIQTKNLPTFLIGHSLSGTCYLLHQATQVDNNVTGVIAIGSAPWNKHLVAPENMLYRYRLKLITKVLRTLIKLYGFIPARQWHFGTDNECATIAKQVILNNMDKGIFTSTSEDINYLTMLHKISCPVLSVASLEDKFATYSHVSRFVRSIKDKEFIVDTNKSHMALALSPKCWRTWKKMSEWMMRFI